MEYGWLFFKAYYYERTLKADLFRGNTLGFYADFPVEDLY
jgi:hypothetical protein